MGNHACHNREFPTVTTVQDGWENVAIRNPINGTANLSSRVFTRVPRMIEIPFTMSHECHQWDLPAGAIHKGLLNPDGCSKCKWGPKVSKG